LPPIGGTTAEHGIASAGKLHDRKNLLIYLGADVRRRLIAISEAVGRLRQELYRVLHELSQLSPIWKVASIHAFFDGSQNPANASDIFDSAVPYRET
ncbi:hypothetical protein, partial [Salmonella sp. s51090]|uniref:hypothetical protein n=1 Tax=Salmonella sp. s51090 TaxID=3159651 RepID=UPI00397F8C9B